LASKESESCKYKFRQVLFKLTKLIGSRSYEILNRRSYGRAARDPLILFSLIAGQDIQPHGSLESERATGKMVYMLYGSFEPHLNQVHIK
jgi:hypothetical protein